MTFGKLENGRLVLCPKSGRDARGRLHTNLPQYYAHAADREGWLEVVYTAPPEDGAYTPGFVEQDGRIVQQWTPYTPDPQPADPVTERFEFIEDCLLEISEKLWG